MVSEDPYDIQMHSKTSNTLQVKWAHYCYTLSWSFSENGDFTSIHKTSLNLSKQCDMYIIARQTD